MQWVTRVPRWMRVSGVSVATVIWAVLFYKNYGQASVVAFGDIAQHMQYLQLVWWRYLLIGVGLIGAWALALYKPAPVTVPEKKPEAQPLRGL